MSIGIGNVCVFTIENFIGLLKHPHLFKILPKKWMGKKTQKKAL
jgi:hypothetical protein